jgi:hypothetical protein
VAFVDALRGYAHPIHRRDGFRCVYCGWDGSVWPNWLFLCQDHLRPVGHPQRNDPAYIVTACQFCNYACNRQWFEGDSPEQVVERRREAVLVVREAYREFWQSNVAQARESGRLDSAAAAQVK